MRCVVQIVSSASIRITSGENAGVVRHIGPGLVALFGLHKDDDLHDSDTIIKQILDAKIFESPDESANGVNEIPPGQESKVKRKRQWQMSIQESDGQILAISQFTLYGRLKNKKPDWSHAMAGAQARGQYAEFLQKLKSVLGEDKVLDGEFGEMMSVQLVNEGPCTFILDSRSD